MEFPLAHSLVIAQGYLLGNKPEFHIDFPQNFEGTNKKALAFLAISGATVLSAVWSTPRTLTTKSLLLQLKVR